MYYVPKKNRCKISCPVSNPAVPPTRTETLFKSTLSSINAYNKGARTVYSVFLSQQYNSQAQANKGTGNLQKRGSGGNSYAAYLARKKGKCLCCFCNQLITQGGTGVNWPTNIPIGSPVTQASTGATGVVISITTGGGPLGDIDTITIRGTDEECKFISGAVDGNDLVVQGASGGGGTGNIIEGFNVTTINDCSQTQ